uniref:Helicase ATP-binding domain-containing protein n=1 Tax=Salix viminalis TaxID=40686 RepID=A0A6N2N4G0_SALVM
MESRYTQIEGGGRACVYNIRDYDVVLTCLKNCKGVEIEKIPFSTLNIIQRLSKSFDAGRWEPCRPEHFTDEKVDEFIRMLPRKLLDALLPFQLHGLRFGLRRGGRSLIADEMGLGKTLQAIAIAGCFINEGPILVVCPAILRFSWAEELERWMPFCLPSEIHLVFGHRNNPVHLTRCPKVVVISYTMLHHLRKAMLEQEWALLIVDESHHIKAVLDVAEKVKRIVLLSGTPSLSRPGLLGQNKYDFAKTYCAVRAVCTYEAKGFQMIIILPICQMIDDGCSIGNLEENERDKDFSKGIRLEELNVLLRQTVMQVGVVANPRNSPTKLCKIVWVCEWLSIHPLISDGVAKLDANHSAQKMIIFAHHLKVLDGVQEFVCKKGVGFVRIDGNTLASDRQRIPCVFALPQYGILLILLLEILVFNSCWGDAVQGCSETDFYGHFRDVGIVKIAIIGITAGGVGLDFSSAQNVVFLELPQSPSLMLQAEDRAHRRGQSNAVNIYIFCAKDTLYETRWQNLNKSLHRVSSTMDGKYDAVPEILVERISYFGKSDKGIRGSSEVQVELPDSGSVWNSQPFKTHNEENILRLEVLAEIILLPRDMSNDQSEKENEADECWSNELYSLRFEVSKYTGIHLYSCILGKDSRPQPLYENFQPEELESLASNDSKETYFKFLKQNPVSRHALLSFIKEWNALRPIERRKLCGKTLQLPLHVELCYLNESTNHRIGGLLKGEASDAVLHWLWPKGKAIHSGLDLMDEPLCKLCQMPCKGSDAKTPRYFEDLFCDLICCEEYRIRTSSRSLRRTIKPLSLERRREYIEEAAPNVASQKKLLDKLANNPCEGNAWHADHIVHVYRGGVSDVQSVSAIEKDLKVVLIILFTRKERKLLNVLNDAQPGKRLGSMNDMKYMEETATNVKGKQEKASNDMGKGLTFSDKFSPKDQQINVGDTSGQGHSRMREEDLVDELLVKVPGSAYSGGLSADPESEELKKSSNEEVDEVKTGRSGYGCCIFLEKASVKTTRIEAQGVRRTRVGFRLPPVWAARATHTMVGNGRSRLLEAPPVPFSRGGACPLKMPVDAPLAG